MTREDISLLIEMLLSKNTKVGCGALNDLLAESEKSSTVYVYMDNFINMLDNSNFYIKSRGMALISANSKWDKENIINTYISKICTHVTDEKPIMARQCIKQLAIITKYKPELTEVIISALKSADISFYSDSMQPLIKKDVAAALKTICKRQ